MISVLIWCLLIIAAPFFAHQHLALPAGLIYLFFSKICHQFPDRSFSIWDNQFAVCARCTGLYFGFFIGTLLFPLFKMSKNFNPPKRYLFFVALTPLIIDLSLSTFHIWQNTFFSRVITGLFLGGVAALFIIPGICNLTKTREEKYGVKT